jgi:hypothetical protein
VGDNLIEPIRLIDVREANFIGRIDGVIAGFPKHVTECRIDLAMSRRELNRTPVFLGLRPPRMAAEGKCAQWASSYHERCRHPRETGRDSVRPGPAETLQIIKTRESMPSMMDCGRLS